jgi:3-dehydroquinate synthase
MNRAIARGARGAASDGASLHRRELSVSAVHCVPVGRGVLDCSCSRASLSATSSCSSSSSNSLFAGVNRRAVQRMSRNVPKCAAVAAPQSSSSSSAMKTVTVDLGDRSYPIYIGPGLLEQGELLRKHIPGKRVLIVTNETIAPLYLDK